MCQAASYKRHSTSYQLSVISYQLSLFQLGIEPQLKHTAKRSWGKRPKDKLTVHCSLFTVH